MRPPCLCFFAALAFGAGASFAASFDDRVAALFRPPVGEMMALSPGGERVAYTAHVGRDLAIAIVNLDPGGSKRTVKLDTDAGAEPGNAEAAPVRLRFLRWATPTRLVFAPTERVVPLPPITDKNGRTVANPDGPTIHSPILAMDADGKQRGVIIDARNFQETPADARKTLADLLRTTRELQTTRDEPVRWRMPHLTLLGFLPREPDQLILETRGAYNDPAQYLVDTRTGNVREFGGQWPSPPGDPQVFDFFRLKVVGERTEAACPTVAWRDDDLGNVQRELEAKFPRRVVEILDWSETRARVLFRVTGGSDPGRVFVYQRTEDLALEVLRCAPWLNASRLNETRVFEFEAPDGAHLSGYVTWPAKPKLTPPPLLLVFASGFPGHAHPAFDPEAQIFADLGFVVARLNHRCVGGIKPQDLTALRTAVDRLAVNDARAAIEWIAQRYPQRPFDRKRVATLGRGFGGYLAVRALQLEPSVFRGGIAIDAPMELRGWFRASEMAGARKKAEGDVVAALVDHEGADWKKLSVVDQAESLKNPVLLLVEPGRSPTIEGPTRQLHARLHELGCVSDCFELESGFAAAEPKARASGYRKMEEFLNLHLYDYAVKIGPTKEVE